jgi:hypothetical protein
VGIGLEACTGRDASELRPLAADGNTPSRSAAKIKINNSALAAMALPSQLRLEAKKREKLDI